MKAVHCWLLMQSIWTRSRHHKHGWLTGQVKRLAPEAQKKLSTSWDRVACTTNYVISKISGGGAWQIWSWWHIVHIRRLCLWLHKWMRGGKKWGHDQTSLGSKMEGNVSHQSDGEMLWWFLSDWNTPNSHSNLMSTFGKKSWRDWGGGNRVAAPTN